MITNKLFQKRSTSCSELDDIVKLLYLWKVQEGSTTSTSKSEAMDDDGETTFF